MKHSAVILRKDSNYQDYNFFKEQIFHETKYQTFRCGNLKLMDLEKIKMVWFPERLSISRLHWLQWKSCIF